MRTLAATARYGPHSYGCWSSSDSTVVFMQPSFAAWIHTVLPFIAIGGRVVFGGKFSAEGFLQTLESERITLAPLVPTLWRMVLTANPSAYDLSTVKTAFFSMATSTAFRSVMRPSAPAAFPRASTPAMTGFLVQAMTQKPAWIRC